MAKNVFITFRIHSGVILMNANTRPRRQLRFLRSFVFCEVKGNSYFVRICRLWNDLPVNIRESELSESWPYLVNLDMS